MKPLGSILQYFEQVDKEESATFYEVKDNYVAYYDNEPFETLIVDDDGSKLMIVSEAGHGTEPIKYSDLDEVEVFKLTKVA